MSSVKVRSLQNVRQLVTTGSGHEIVSDEAPDVGENLGPSPHEMLLGALAACTSMTLKLYARRKGWHLAEVEVEATHERVREGDIVERSPDSDRQVVLIRLNIVAKGELDDGQRERLLQIAGRCPVRRTLEGGPLVIDSMVAVT